MAAMRWITPGLLLLFLAGGGCAPKQTLGMQQPVGPDGLTLNQVQQELMVFADTHVSLVAEACDKVTERIDDPQRRNAAQAAKLGTALGAWTIAAYENPLVGLVDMVVMADLEYQAAATWTKRFDEQDATLVTEAYRLGRDRIWALAGRALPQESLAQIRTYIENWRRDHPEQEYVTHVRLADFTEFRTGIQANVKSGTSLLGLALLDPLAGLDPATREIQQSRLLAERAFYFAARAPVLLGWQAQQVLYKYLATGEMQKLIDDAGRFVTVSERFATIAEALPEDLGTRITAEREAAVSQIQAAVARERELLLAELEAGTGELRGTLAELRQTVEAGTALSESVNTALGSADALASKLRPPHEGGRAEPLDLAQVRDAISASTAAVQEANQLVLAIDDLLAARAEGDRIAELGNVLAAVETSGNRVVFRAFLYAVALVGLIFVLSFLRFYVQKQ